MKMNVIYKHTQVGYVIIISIGAEVLFVLGTILTQGSDWIFFSVLLLLMACAILFATLTVEIQNNTLTWHFGPGFWRKQISLSDIQNCEVVKNRWYYGWGIHLTPYGWLYNVSGLSAVQILLKNGKQIRLGTDEPEELCRAIKESL
ncbi:MAG: hypothetical protein ABIB46_02780 [bacterium]